MLLKVSFIVFSSSYNDYNTVLDNHIFFSIDCTDGKMVYSGPRTNYIASDLTPVTRYSFHLQASTEGDDSPQSNVVSVITLESGKSET